MFENITNVYIFRVCSAVLTLGVSMLSFVLPGIVFQRSPLAFIYLQNITLGFAVGMGFIGYELNSLQYGGLVKWNILLSSGSFFLMVVLEQLSTSVSFGYSVLATAEEDIEMSTLDNEETETIEPSNNYNESDKSINSSRKYHLVALLLFSTIFDLLEGFLIGSREHYEYIGLVRLVVHKMLLSLTFGTVLQLSIVPDRIFILFMFTFALSTPLGLVVSASFSLAILKWSQFMVCLSIASAVSGGVFIYLSTCLMLPGYLEYSRGWSRAKKALSLLVVAVGFAFVVFPYYISF